MYPPPDDLAAVLRQLRTEPSLGQRLTGRDPRLEAVERLAALGRPDVLPYLAGALVRGGALAAAAADAAATLLERATPVELREIDRRMRAQNHWYGLTGFDAAWYRADADALTRHTPQGPARLAYLGLASFHPSGYVREWAVRLLAATDAEVLPFLLLRLNDWVAPVREAALAGVEGRLHARHAPAFAETLPLVLSLGRQQRHEAGDLPRRVLALLTAPEQHGILVPLLRAAALPLRRDVHRAALEAGGGAAAKALDAAMVDADLVVRLQAARALRRGLPGLDAGRAQEAADRFRQDPYGNVRREALSALVERAERDAARDAEPALRDALLDASGGVREIARHHLLRLGLTTPSLLAAFYRMAVDADPSGEGCALPAALAGLAETGGPPDAARARALVQHHMPSVRRAALRATAALGAASHAEAIVRAVADVSPSVSRTALRLVVEHRLASAFEAPLAGLLSTAHVRRHALRALATLPHWDAITHLLRSACDADARIGEAACDDLKRWLTRSTNVFTVPMPPQLARARSAFEDARPCLPERLRRDLASTLARHG